MTKEIIVAASGFFDPLHIGHLEYLKRSKELGDKLIVIVNTDKQAIIKKGFSFMGEKERLEIISSLKFVDQAIFAIDNDSTVIKTLEQIKPDIFAKGGDRNISNIPEREICEKLGIKMIDNLGEKITSSSKLIKEAASKIQK
ncbi:MAG: adenylyltransferase/cytidyltransferase family protein [Candidatus Nanoarchaeia archaeon]